MYHNYRFHFRPWFFALIFLEHSITTDFDLTSNDLISPRPFNVLKASKGCSSKLEPQPELGRVTGVEHFS